MLVAISKIAVGERIRKEYGDIGAFAEDIKANGMLNPLTVMQGDGEGYQLLAGLRRLRAAEFLGWAEVAVNVVDLKDAADALRIEISENEQRKEFSFREKMDFAKLLKDVEVAKAKERKKEGQSLGGSLAGKSRPKDDSLVDARPPSYEEDTISKQKTRDVVGSAIGMGGRTYSRAEYIIDNAPDDVIDKIESGECTIYKAYNDLRNHEKPQEPTNDEAAQEAAMPHDADVVTNDAEPLFAESQPPNCGTAADTNADVTTPKAKKPTKPRMEKDPFYQKLKAEEDAAMSKEREFDALSAEEKITELKRQLKDARVRANIAEADLAREKDLRFNDTYHRDGTIEMLQQKLDEAQARIKELETKYEPS